MNWAKYNCKTRRESLKFCDLVRLILDFIVKKNIICQSLLDCLQFTTSLKKVSNDVPIHILLVFYSSRNNYHPWPCNWLIVVKCYLNVFHTIRNNFKRCSIISVFHVCVSLGMLCRSCLFINTTRPRKINNNFADGIFKLSFSECILLNSKWKFIQINFKILINTKPALAHIIDSRRTGDLTSVPMMD